jgi:translocation and assembly module TamB
VLRWNLDGNVASNPIVIVQAPERVIDNVAITRQMCQGWLKYVAPLLADVTSVQGNLSLQIDEAAIVPTDWRRQTVKGQLMVHGANVGPGPLADQLLMLVNQVRALRKGAGATDGGGAQTSWLQLPEQKINFDVEQGRVAHRNLQIQAGDVVINTSGAVGIDGALELIAAVPIQKDWLDKAPALQPLAGQQLQIPIRGTIQRPQLDMSSFASIGQQLATAALQGAAQKQIDKGLNKLLGPLSGQLAPLQQGMQQMQQGVQQNMPQFPNLPIPGFGNGGFGAGLFGGGQQQPPPAQPPTQPQP